MGEKSGRDVERTVLQLGEPGLHRNGHLRRAPQVVHVADPDLAATTVAVYGPTPRRTDGGSLR